MFENKPSRPAVSSFITETRLVLQLLLIRGSGVGATFLMGVLIARSYGTGANGLFQVGIGFMMLSAAIARLGQDQLNLRRMAELKVSDDSQSAVEVMRGALRVATPATILAAICVVAFPFLSESRKDAYFLAAFGLAVAPFALLWIVTEGLRGWQSVLSASFWQGVFAPVLFTLLLLFFMWYSRLPALALPLIYAGCICLGLTGAQIAWRRELGGTVQYGAVIKAPFSWRRQVHDGRYFWCLAVLTNVAGWLDLLMLYAVADAREVGVFFAIVRTGALIAVALNIAASGAVARLALLYADRRLGEFARVMRNYSIGFAVFAVLTAITFALAAQMLLAIWGSDVAFHQTEFKIYLVIQLLQSVFILPQLVAAVIGMERSMTVIQLVMVPLKAAAIYQGYMTAGLLGVVCGIGAVMIASAAWTAVLFTRRLKQDGIGLRALITG